MYGYKIVRVLYACKCMLCLSMRVSMYVFLYDLKCVCMYVYVLVDAFSAE